MTGTMSPQNNGHGKPSKQGAWWALKAMGALGPQNNGIVSPQTMGAVSTLNDGCGGLSTQWAW